MPSPNGYWDCDSIDALTLGAVELTLDGAIVAGGGGSPGPPWGSTGPISSYTMTWEVSTSATGPWTPADLAESDGCTDAPDGAQPWDERQYIKGLTPGQDLFVRVTLFDGSNTQVDQHVCPEGGPHVVANLPTAHFCSTQLITDTSARAGYNLAGGVYDTCNPDTVEFEWGLVGAGFPNTTGPQPLTSATQLTAQLTGLTCETDYEYRAIVTNGGTGTPYPNANPTPVCTFTTAACPVTNPNSATCATGYVKDTQFRADWTVDNVATTDVILVVFGTAAGGPYPQQGATTAGTNAPGQSSSLIASNGVFSVLPSTTYFYRTEVRQGGPTGPVISASPECSLTTDAAGTADWFGAISAARDRNGIIVGIGPIDDWHLNPANTESAASPQDWIGIEHSVNGAPFVAVPAQHLYQSGGGGPLGFNPYRRDGNAGANQGANVLFPYAAGDTVAHRITYYVESGGGAPGDVRQVVTLDAVTTPLHPDVECQAVDVTQTSATIRFSDTVQLGQWNDQTDPGGEPYDNRDILRVVYGTVAGGPYPLQSSGPRVTQANINDQPLTGLTPGTTYYYRMQADEYSEATGSPNQRNTTATARRNEFLDVGECSFTTLAPPEPQPRPTGVLPEVCDDETGTGGDPAEPSTSTDDELLCDVQNNGDVVLFWRRVSNDGEGGVTVSTVDAAGAAYTPTGTVEACAGEQQVNQPRIEEEAVCADLGGAIPVPVMRRVTVDAAGVESVAYLLGQGAGGATTDVTGAVQGWSAGDCDAEYEVLCDVNGDPFRMRHGQPTAANPSGLSYFTLAGGVINPPPTGPFQLCDAQDVNDPTSYATTVVDVTGGATQTFTPSGDLTSWTVRNRDATTATVQVNGGAVLPLDVAETLGASLSGHDVNDVLEDTIVVASGDGAVRVTVTRRLP